MIGRRSFVKGFMALVGALVSGCSFKRSESIPAVTRPEIVKYPSSGKSFYAGTGATKEIQDAVKPYLPDGAGFVRLMWEDEEKMLKFIREKYGIPEDEELKYTDMEISS